MSKFNNHKDDELQYPSAEKCILGCLTFTGQNDVYAEFDNGKAVSTFSC